MKLLGTLVLALAVGTSASESSAGGDQTPLPPVLTQLLGEWRGSGVVTGRASEMTMAWSRDVGGAFVHLRFRNAMAEGGGRPAQVFEGRGYYRAAPATASNGTGTWLDSRGMIFPVAFTLSPDALTSDWGGASTERGRTVYRLTPAGTLEVIDFVRLSDGQYREFGRAELKRSTLLDPTHDHRATVSHVRALLGDAAGLVEGPGPHDKEAQPRRRRIEPGQADAGGA